MPSINDAYKKGTPELKELSPLMAVRPTFLDGNKTAGLRDYELTDHLSNVMAVISDRKLSVDTNNDNITDYYAPQVVSFTDYYPFGFPIVERSGNLAGYRFGFNGQEADNEAYGVKQSYTAEFWQYDTRLGRRWNVDPKGNISASFYACFGNNPIIFSDSFGDTTNYYNATTGKLLGTIYGSERYNDRFISEDEYKKITLSMNQKMNEAINEAIVNIKDSIKIEKVTKELNRQYTNQIENNLETVSTPLILNSDLGFLARIGFAEFRGSSSIVQQIAMDIVLNRVSAKKFPNTIESVIKQKWQFSSLNEGDPNKPYYENPYGQMYNSKGQFLTINHNAWIKTVENAFSIKYNITRGISQGATLYYSPKSMKPKGSIAQWNFNVLIEINISGVNSNEIRLFKNK